MPLGIKFVDKDSVSNKAFCTNKRGAMTKILPNEPYKYVKRDKKGRIKKSKKNKKGSSYKLLDEETRYFSAERNRRLKQLTFFLKYCCKYGLFH